MIELANRLIEENAIFDVIMKDLEAENASLKEANILLSQKLSDRPTTPPPSLCLTCKGKRKEEESGDRPLTVKDRDLIFTSLNKVSEKLDQMSTKQTTFVKSRAGLGFGNPEAVSSSKGKDKFVIDLQKKVDTLESVLYSVQNVNAYLKNKVQVLEKSSTQDRSWFVGQKTHSMYQRQAQGKGKAILLEKKPRNYPCRGKYGCNPEHDICTYCGGNFHKHYSCAKKQADEARRNSQAKGKGRSPMPKARSPAPPKPKVLQPNARKVYRPITITGSSSTNKSDLQISGANTTKPHKVWVVKT